jgi:hypothetical protein
MRNEKLKWHIFIFLYELLGSQLFEEVINGASAVVFYFSVFGSRGPSFDDADELSKLNLCRAIFVNKLDDFDHLLSVLDQTQGYQRILKFINANRS